MQLVLKLFSLMCIMGVLAGCGSDPIAPSVSMPYAVPEVGKVHEQAVDNAKAVAQIKQELESTEEASEELAVVINEQEVIIAELEEVSEEDKQKLQDSINKLKLAYETVVERLATVMNTAKAAQDRAEELSDKVAKKDEEAERLRAGWDVLEVRAKQDAAKIVEIEKDLKVAETEIIRLTPYYRIVWSIVAAVALFIFIRYCLPPILRVLAKFINPLS